MSKDDDGMPPQPATKRIEAVPPWAIEMTVSMKEGFRVTNANIEVVANDLGVVKDRVSILETERAKFSGGIRGLSTSNAEQDAQLAQERAARENVAKEVRDLKESQAVQLAILARLDRVASNPTVKVLLFLAGTAATGYLASKGMSK